MMPEVGSLLRSRRGEAVRRPHGAFKGDAVDDNRLGKGVVQAPGAVEPVGDGHRLGERGPLWVTAAEQTAGRGRRGRPFVSERGNLYASLLLTDPSPADRAAELSFVAALALHDAVCELAATLASRIRFKWPNDLICDGAKFAGILVEGEGASGRPLAAVVGIGVNCAHHPAGMAYPAPDLAAGIPVPASVRALTDPERTICLVAALASTFMTLTGRIGSGARAVCCWQAESASAAPRRRTGAATKRAHKNQ